MTRKIHVGNQIFREGLSRIVRGGASWRHSLRSRRLRARLLPPLAMVPIIEKNRLTLEKVPSWIDDATYENSVFGYGLPKHLRGVIDLEIGNELTYTDVLVYLCTTFRQPVRYLELGVSVGKNFVQMLYALTNCELVGFDIEDINPTIANRLTSVSSTLWDSPEQSLKSARSSFTQYRFNENNNIVSYISADIWDEQAWTLLEGKRFNVLFSDALHTPEALVHEYRMLEKYDLLADDFVMLWDDLNGSMQDAFREIVGRFDRLRPLGRSESSILDLRGWLGIHEDRHPVGFYRRYGNTGDSQ